MSQSIKVYEINGKLTTVIMVLGRFYAEKIVATLKLTTFIQQKLLYFQQNVILTVFYANF